MHSPAGSYAPYRLQWGPSVQPIRRLPVQLFQRTAANIPLVGGQAQGKISAAGTLTLDVGPAGLGVLWFPASATLTTTSGINDSSTCNVYLGPSGQPVTLVATAFPGGAAVVSLPVPSMAPGQYLIAVWTGGNSGDVAAFNIQGTMQALIS
jgi:hypothetical protein